MRKTEGEGKTHTFETNAIIVARIVGSLLDNPIGLLPSSIFHGRSNDFEHPTQRD